MVDAFQLCYVKNNWAYFTSCPIALQWGADWNVAPYEFNAELPYSDHLATIHGVETRISHDILKVAWDGPFETPCDSNWNLSYSVEDINIRKCSPWLQDSSKFDGTKIWAGTSLIEFERIINSLGGSVYLAQQKISND